LRVEIGMKKAYDFIRCYTRESAREKENVSRFDFSKTLDFTGNNNRDFASF